MPRKSRKSRFQRVIADLRADGWSQQEIADYCGCAQPVISRLLNNKEADPRWTVGDKLIQLHIKVRSAA